MSASLKSTLRKSVDTLTKGSNTNFVGGLASCHPHGHYLSTYRSPHQNHSKKIELPWCCRRSTKSEGQMARPVPDLQRGRQAMAITKSRTVVDVTWDSTDTWWPRVVAPVPWPPEVPVGSLSSGKYSEELVLSICFSRPLGLLKPEASCSSLEPWWPTVLSGQCRLSRGSD